MASDFLYAHPTDNVADAVTPTGSADSVGLSWSRAIDKNPATAYEAAATGAWQKVWDFGTPVNIRWATLVMPNIPAGTANVLLEGNSVNSWPGAVSVTFTIPAWADDGFPWNPYVINSDVTAYRYWRISVPSIGVPLKFNEIALFNSYRLLEFNINWEADLNERTLITEHRTSHNVLSEYDKGIRWLELTGEIDATDNGREAMRAWVRAAGGRARRFFIVPDLVDPQLPHAWMVKFMNTDLLQNLVFLDWTKLTVGWEELSRGLKP